MSPTVESTEAPIAEAISTSVKARSRSAILQYLSQWKYERDAWRFRKNVQSAMMRSIFDRGVLPKKHFKLALAYLSTVKGASRERLLAEARRVKSESKKSKSEDVASEQQVEPNADISTDSQVAQEQAPVASTTETLTPDNAPQTSSNNAPIPSAKDLKCRRKRAKKLLKVLKAGQ